MAARKGEWEENEEVEARNETARGACVRQLRGRYKCPALPLSAGKVRHPRSVDLTINVHRDGGRGDVSVYISAGASSALDV